ncbi:MAG: hypothetical protein OIF47_17360, partial [Marinibacterium sp.]|nr:hypothetical protein [Marinibacterium sp.]
ASELFNPSSPAPQSPLSAAPSGPPRQRLSAAGEGVSKEYTNTPQQEKAPVATFSSKNSQHTETTPLFFDPKHKSQTPHTAKHQTNQTQNKYPQPYTQTYAPSAVNQAGIVPRGAMGNRQEAQKNSFTPK